MKYFHLELSVLAATRASLLMSRWVRWSGATWLLSVWPPLGRENILETKLSRKYFFQK